jgi:hypothetical protein
MFVRPSRLGFVSFLSLVANAAFTSQTCGWGQLCVDVKNNQTATNHPLWCFYPSPDTSAIVSGCGSPPASDWHDVMVAHMSSNRAVAYYGLDLTYIGDGNMAVSKLVYLCVSGLAEGSPRTLCSTVSRDDDLSDSGSGCYTNAVPKNVTDGCYDIASKCTLEVDACGRQCS